ncbi:hypothetical protein N7499_002271 [Penicillium canescens]|uniref:Uncharacterized protein n=1 Tax=Penicillium canescens TaxID=5083 RepID=A0AAD6I805_PENCN|nr:uncharacterized protein N7446_009814 [Penicillium canescens]KAJ6001862.1 hypothetical protein N7522_007089 [Penicillium canescens]KAJ6035054.1 hypothetical protein N7460_009229 [Penicillium canescens]KAJ6046716.1 hypothetical protein N7444_007970 [Penicillium canescens]KAJ6053802.1 hypothetical protein N7446_009814 [Penicillium canescens]KAJ6097897.1 hypothetical protein N7499_002271 [Penicillium canescens]
MSSALPYLKSLKKGDLVEFADSTDLNGASGLNKMELAVALDNHLNANRSIFSGVKSLSEYYSRLASPPRRGSPVKRESKPQTPGPATKTPSRRASAKKEVKEQKEEPSEDGEDVAATPSARQTSRRISRAAPITDLQRNLPMPPSPAVVTDVIDRQASRVREGLEDAWTSIGVLDRCHAVREALSSLKAIEIMVLLLEGGSVVKEIVPIRYLTTTPPVQAAQIPAVPIKVPDLFVLLTGAFWAPFSLWLITCLLLPLTAAYFINLSWQASTTVRRTRSSPNLAQFDPLTFNIAKALLVYIVFGNDFKFWGAFSTFALRKISASVPGGTFGLYTGTAVGAIGSLYEAILSRS